MEHDAHGFSDSETDSDLEIRSNPFLEDEGLECAEGALESGWEHPYEDMELITPPAKIELREFPVVDVAQQQAVAACKQERAPLKPHSAPGSEQAEAGSAAPRVTRLLGKGSWTIRVTQGGGLGRVAHRENPGPERRAILPCVEREGPGEVLVGALGGRGWEFTEVGRSDKRAMSLLWPKEKCAGGAKGGGKARLPEVDLADMTPEERLQRERRDEKNRKERERRAHQKLEKQRLAREAELAQAAAVPAGPPAAQCAGAPGTPAPGTPNTLLSQAGTPQPPAKADDKQCFMDVDEKDAPATSHTSHGAASTPCAAPAARPQTASVSGSSFYLSSSAAPPPNQPSTSAPSASPVTQVSTSQGALPGVTTPAVQCRAASAAPAQTFAVPPAPCPVPVSASTRPYAGKKLPSQATPAASPAVKAAAAAFAVPAAPATGTPAAHAAPPTDPSRLAGKATVSGESAPKAPCPTTSAPVVVAMLPGKVPAPVEAAPKTVPSATPLKFSGGSAPLSPKRPASLPSVSKDIAPKDGDEAMKVEKVREDKENLQDDDTSVALAQDRGRVATLEETDEKCTLSKKRRTADLSPVNLEVNCRGGETKRAARARGVQRA